jgi:hypothetical protein
MGWTTTTKRARKSQAKKAARKSSFIQHQNDNYSNDLWMFEKGKWKVVSPFFLFQISFILFWFFYFLKCKGEQKQICSGKGEKKMVDLGVREKIQMQMVEEGWKRKWDNYRFTSRRELHVYSPRTKLSTYLWRLICRCDWRSCRHWCGLFSGVSPNVRPRVEALLWMKTIAGVHVLIGRGSIATHMTCLPSRSISLQHYGEDSCEKASFWSNNHSCPNKTRNDTQEAGDPIVPFPRSIMAVGGGESLLLCQSHVLFHSNKIQNNNGRWHKLDFLLWSELSNAMDLVGSSLNYSSSWPLARKLFSQWSDLHTSTSICPQTARLSSKNFLDDKPVFHLEILQNIILKVFPYLDDGSVNDLLRSCRRIMVLQIMMIIEVGQWSDRFSIRSLRSCPRVLALQRLTNNLTAW